MLPCLMKQARQSISRIATSIFQESMESGEVPWRWKMGYISPVHKSGSTSLPSNYRPICLTSHVIKSQERVIKKKMVAYLEALDKMDPDQHGGRGGRSTLSQLLQHYFELTQMLEEGDNVDVIYADMAKAYQKVDHGVLLYKIRSLGFRGRLLRWISNFLKNRTQFVLIDGELSEGADVLSSVPEGSVLGPLFFLIHMSDIGVNIHSSIKIFVDDSKISRVIRNEEDVEELQSDLDTLFSWAKTNNMQFNGKKFQVLRYGKNTELKESTTYFTENTSEIVEREESVRDLGVIMSEDATFKLQIDKVVAKANQKASWVLRTFQTRSIFLMKSVFKTLVLPHLDYCSQLWAPCKATEILKLEKVQKNFLRRIPCLRNQSYWSQLETLKMFSIQRRHERYRVIYVWKLIEKMVPDCGITVTHESETRLGRRVGAENLRRVSNLTESTFQVQASKLFNSLPKSLRNLTKCGVGDFKAQLDNYLSTLYDEPPSPGHIPRGLSLTGHSSNSILHQKTKSSTNLAIMRRNREESDGRRRQPGH